MSEVNVKTSLIDTLIDNVKIGEMFRIVDTIYLITHIHHSADGDIRLSVIFQTGKTKNVCSGYYSVSFLKECAEVYREENFKYYSILKDNTE